MYKQREKCVEALDPQSALVVASEGFHFPAKTVATTAHAAKMLQLRLHLRV